MLQAARDLGRGPRAALVLASCLCVLSVACVSRRAPFQYTPAQRTPVSGGPLCVLTSFDTDPLPKQTRALFDRNLRNSLVVALQSELIESVACGKVVGFPEELPEASAHGEPDDPILLSVTLWSGGWYLPDEDARADANSLAVTALWIIDPIFILFPLVYHSSETTTLHGVAQLVVEVSSPRRDAFTRRGYVGESVSVRTRMWTRAGNNRRLAFESAYLDALGKLRSDLPTLIREIVTSEPD